MATPSDPNAPHPHQTHLTNGAVQGLIDGLGRIDPSLPYGTGLALALDRVKPTVAFEFVWLRRGDRGQTQVYLARRLANGQGYDGEWCAQGTSVRMSDGRVEETDDFEVAEHQAEAEIIKRLEGEFGAPVQQFNFVSYCLNPLEERNGQRGFYVGLIFFVEVAGDGLVDETHGWFDIDQLPKPMVRVHEQWIIPFAVAAFERHHKQAETSAFG